MLFAREVAKVWRPVPEKRSGLVEKAILLAVAASFCTAAASVAQRQGARSVPSTGGLDLRLILRLARRPIWLLGIVSMIAGFLFQLTALRYGALALVQPILALELLLVFGYMAIAGRRQVRIKRRDWVAAAAMSAGIAVFLRLASPSGGRLHAPGGSWLLAGLITFGAVLVAVAVASGLGHRPGASSTRRAALLGTATGIAWGFVAAIIKELSSHLGGGLGAVFSTWSLYVLLAVGAAAMLLASHALAAGPLAASQPGFTILDPLTAALLGVFLFAENIRTGPWDLAGEALALALVIAGAWGLSRSCFILGEFGDPSCLPAGFQAQARGKRLSLPDAAQPGPWPAQQRQSEFPGTGDAPASPRRTAQPGHHAADAAEQQGVRQAG
jgi:drug/metabolite transporter (DMT)-like permease